MTLSQDCFLHLWLYFCFANKFICITFFFFFRFHIEAIFVLFCLENLTLKTHTYLDGTKVPLSIAELEIPVVVVQVVPIPIQGCFWHHLHLHLEVLILPLKVHYYWIEEVNLICLGEKMCKMPEICTLEHQEVSNYTQAVDAVCWSHRGQQWPWLNPF